MKKIIAITGGIGSGKSTVTQIIGQMGYETFSADEEYKECLKDEAFVVKICDAFCVEPIICDGKKTIDRRRLSEIVFKDEEKKKLLNSITHPCVMQSLMDKAKLAKGELVFCEVPLLFEGRYERYFDDTIVVMRAEEERVNAVFTRDGLSKDDIKKRIDSQFDYKKVDENKYKILWNDGNLHILNQKVKSIIDGLIERKN